MNKNYNEEHEIKRNVTIKYPFTQVSDFEVNTTNYKSWIGMCTRENSREYGKYNKNAVIIATGIGWAVLGFIPVVGPGLSAAAGVLNVVIPFIWPEEAGPPGSNQAQFTWEQIMNAVEELTDNKINSSIRERAIETTRILQSRMRDYQQAICNLKENTDKDKDKEYKEDVRREFNDAEDQLKSAIIQFSHQDENPDIEAEHNILLLASFAQAANLHLLLLKDVVQFGQYWGFTEEQVEQYYSNKSTSVGNPGMVQLLAQYTDYCTKWYHNGLNKLKPQNIDQKTWNKYNDFRRDMTIMVLDIVSLWPTYDPKRYPLFTKSQLTRQVYTQLIDGYYSEPNLAPPSLVKWLKEVTFYFREVSDEEQAWEKTRGQFVGYKMKFVTTMADDCYEIETPIVGEMGAFDDTVRFNGEVYKVSSINLKRESTIDQEDINLAHYLQKLELYFDSNVIFVIGTDYAGQNEFETVVINQGLACDNSVQEICEPCMSSCATSKDMSFPCDNLDLYSESLSWVGALYRGTNFPNRGLADWVFGWTHRSVDIDNQVLPQNITQIPAVKAKEIISGQVIEGLGSTGGNLVRLDENNQMLLGVTIVSDLSEKISGYYIRLRYASNQNNRLTVSYYFEKEQVDSIEFDVLKTYDGQDLWYCAFGHQTVMKIPNPKETKEYTIKIENKGNGSVIIDKVEFLPIEDTLEAYQENENLERARNAVNALFINEAKDTLRLNTTDYEIDQVSKLVECLSDELSTYETIVLLDQVKFAKQLSKKRNLLNYGDFEFLNWSGRNGWKASPHVYVKADNQIFKGHYLHMPAAIHSKLNDTIYPTYVYQKVDESKLKSYTRYLVRGFISDSKDLELLVERYGEDVHVKMDVPNNIFYNLSIGESTKHIKTSGSYKGLNAFSFYIDTGLVEIKRNLGIIFALKITSINGSANVGNLEIIEEQPLVGEALKRVKKREQEWEEKMKHQCYETDMVVRDTRNAINTLFTSLQYNELKFDTLFFHILKANNLVQQIPYVCHPFLMKGNPVVPGMNFNIFQQLLTLVEKAKELYYLRNVVPNGTFNEGIGNWCVSNGVRIKQEGNNAVLILREWQDKAIQRSPIDAEQGYFLRVTARKEGSGFGYVVIHDSDNMIEKLKFTSCDHDTDDTVSVDSLMGYVTKTAEIFPGTNQVCIEIGETAGVFKIVSVELIKTRDMKKYILDGM
ncbi:hypothetical protein GH866_29995 [Bacillus thuringiensis]|nr:hypothetical protein [Bacillus thuringiensis]